VNAKRDFRYGGAAPFNVAINGDWLHLRSLQVMTRFHAARTNPLVIDAQSSIVLPPYARFLNCQIDYNKLPVAIKTITHTILHCRKAVCVPRRLYCLMWQRKRNSESIIYCDISRRLAALEFASMRNNIIKQCIERIADCGLRIG
jgi:hypothetical protein